MSLIDAMVNVNLFRRKVSNEIAGWDTGTFVGRPFQLNFLSTQILVCDFWKEQAHGLPQGCFLLAYYDCDPDKPELEEALLLRVRAPATLPTEREVVSSMVEYYKENLRTGNTKVSALDEFTRYDFSFSGLECSILGSFYNLNGKLCFGADVENFYSAHNYSVIKPDPQILAYIVNRSESGAASSVRDFRIGCVRYSSSRRFQTEEEDVPVYVKAADFTGKRTGLFGMTRTGKSNTIKKIIQANEYISNHAPHILDKTRESPDELLKAYTRDGFPKYPVGQIIFDMNGEYANANLQDEGTAIFDLYKNKTVRYSILDKPGFSVMKINFFKEIVNGFELIRENPEITRLDSQYVKNFCSVDLVPPAKDDTGAVKRYERKIALYQCVLVKAMFTPPANAKIRFSCDEKLREYVMPGVNPDNGLTFQQACQWFENLWHKYKDEVFEKYKEKNGKEWADGDMQSLLVMLTRCRKPKGRPDCSGFRILLPLREFHTPRDQAPFERDILEKLREGNIIIVDLSIGDELIQKTYSEKISKAIFSDCMKRFTSMQPNNFIQFYFEEAHNLFPKKEDKDLAQIYNKLAKEGAKLNIGLVYATQEASSISSNILKNTQNWFISHLNNQDEIKELKKYYDFSDFSDSLIRFSQDTDKGFARVKTYSNPFAIPIQIDKFMAEKGI